MIGFNGPMPNTMRLAFCTLLVVLVGCTSTPQPAVTDSPAVAPGDRLAIVITNRECPDIHEVVDASGSITMPFVGTLRVAGMTLDQVTETIEAAHWPPCFSEPIRVSLARDDGCRRRSSTTGLHAPER